jgi:hypothetical protein
MSVSTYRKALPVADALQFTGTNSSELDEWLGPTYHVQVIPEGPQAGTYMFRMPNFGQTRVRVEPGQWVSREQGQTECQLYYDGDFQRMFELMPPLNL